MVYLKAYVPCSTLTEAVYSKILTSFSKILAMFLSMPGQMDQSDQVFRTSIVSKRYQLASGDEPYFDSFSDANKIRWFLYKFSPHTYKT